MQRLEELNKCGSFGWTQILAICGHVAAALKNLTDQLILSETRRDEIQSRTALSADACDRMAVAALLRLKDNCALPLKGTRILGIAKGNRRPAAPRAHLRAPWRESAEMRQHTPSNRDRGQHKDRDWAPVPALLSFTRIKREGHKSRNSEYGSNQQKRRLKAWWKIGQNGIKPKEEEIRLRRSLNNRWVGLAARAVGA